MVSSTLRLAVGGVPYSHGFEGGDWFYRHAVSPEGPTDLDRWAVADFLRYERQHGRRPYVDADRELAGWAAWGVPKVREHPALLPRQCCSFMTPGGCGGLLLCHGAPTSALDAIFRTHELRSACLVAGCSPEALARESSWREPPDYFDYVMFAMGSCTTPEAAATARANARPLSADDLRPGYPRTVRFYFDWEDLADHPGATFDGVHVVKVRRRVSLELASAIVIPDDVPISVRQIPKELRDRIRVVDTWAPTPLTWAQAALAAAIELRSPRGGMVLPSAHFREDQARD